MNFRVAALSISLVCSSLYAGSFAGSKTSHGEVRSTSDISAYLPKTKEEIETRQVMTKTQFQEQVDKILALPEEERNFETVIYAYDRASGALHTQSGTLEMMALVHPSKEVRDAATQGHAYLTQAEVEVLSERPELYTYFAELIVHGKVPTDKVFYAKRVESHFKAIGMHLPKKERQEVKELHGELANLSMEFKQNIQEDQSSILATYQELYGLPPEFISQLEKRDGQYVLTCDYPVFFPVMSLCKSQDIRRELFTVFQNRAYPKNEAVLEQMIAKRDHLAKKLGYPSYASLEIETQMVESEEAAHQFVDEMVERCNPVADREFDILANNLPKDVYLNDDNTLNSFDMAYVVDNYKKQVINLDEQVVAEYFPLEKTFEGLISIYEKFFGLSIQKEKVKGLWHEDVEVLSVSKDKQVLGYVLFDLHPREGKYGHACNATALPAVKNDKGQTIALTTVVANFPKPSEGRPSLLRHGEVTTFFHEFGHAIHNVLGSTDMVLACGTSCSTDFVELPSQLLEEWMYDREMLKMVSSHYETQQPLPDAIIDKIVSSRSFCAGLFYLRQCYLAKLSLEFYKDGAEKNTNMIEHKLRNQIIRHSKAMEETHMHNSFGHLDQYGPLYYGYMWSKVFALDIFEQIEKEGLLDPKAGERYVAEILGKGGSEDPNVMLENYLKRKPSMDPFIKSLGGIQ